jgi:hypothetical protein
VESSCEFGIEPSGSIKCWGTPSVLTPGDLSSGALLHRVSMKSYLANIELLHEDRQTDITKLTSVLGSLSQTHETYEANIAECFIRSYVFVYRVHRMLFDWTVKSIPLVLQT